jgi:TonB family protein
MKPMVKLGLLLLVMVSIVACPLAAMAGEKEGVFTVFRVLVGQPQSGEGGQAHVLAVPGPFVFLGKSPEQDAKDVLQVMDRLKASYGLAQVSIAGTSAVMMTPQKEVPVAVPGTKEAAVSVPGSDIRVGVTLLDSDATKAAYAVTLTRTGEPSSQSKVVVIRGERGLIGTRDGAAAPYVFLTIEPLAYPAHDGKPLPVIPKLVDKVNPVYPEDARKARVAGVVILEATVGADGTVTAVKPVRSEPMGLTEAALAAVRQWRYEPARDAAGKAVETTLLVTINFLLS